MPMNVILLERVPKLGQMGDVVKVKPGFARNYLLPQKKALRATKDNITYFESQRKTLEAQNLERRKEAEAVGRQDGRPQGHADPPGLRGAAALRLGHLARHRRRRRRRRASRSSAARSSSTSRSRRWARTRSRSTSIRRSRSRSPRWSPARPTRPSSSPRAARWSPRPSARRSRRRKPPSAPPRRPPPCSKPSPPRPSPPPKARLAEAPAEAEEAPAEKK